MSKRITHRDEETRQSYRESIPRQLGNLHQRMKIVMDMARHLRSIGVLGGLESQALWHALHDLELEVSYHVPADPPYGWRGLAARSARAMQDISATQVVSHREKYS